MSFLRSLVNSNQRTRIIIIWFDHNCFAFWTSSKSFTQGFVKHQILCFNVWWCTLRNGAILLSDLWIRCNIIRIFGTFWWGRKNLMIHSDYQIPHIPKSYLWIWHWFMGRPSQSVPIAWTDGVDVILLSMASQGCSSHM